jgi:hypothetical protein
VLMVALVRDCGAVAFAAWLQSRISLAVASETVRRCVCTEQPIVQTTRTVIERGSD